MAKKRTAKKVNNPGLGQTPKPILRKQTGESIVAESVSDQIRRKKNELDELTSSRREELLAQRDAIDAELQELGHLEIKLMKEGRKPRVEKGERQKADEPCKICGFKTEPLHDARKHRSQGKDKKPFTEVELGTLGLQKAS